MGRIESLQEFAQITDLATKFLICGTLKAELPYAKIYEVREKNRRLGLGLMGVHEWLIKRGYRYEVVPELHLWLGTYQTVSDDVSAKFADELGVSVQSQTERLLLQVPLAFSPGPPPGSNRCLPWPTSAAT